MVLGGDTASGRRNNTTGSSSSRDPVEPTASSSLLQPVLHTPPPHPLAASRQTTATAPTASVASVAAAARIAELEFQDAQQRLFFVFPELQGSLQKASLLANHPPESTAAAAAQSTPPTPTTLVPQRLFSKPDAVAATKPIPSLAAYATTTTTSTPRMERQTGVLWKRRDVFRNRWRPRWFALNPGQGVLTYYLLTSPLVVATTGNGTPATPSTPLAYNTTDADNDDNAPWHDAETPQQRGSSSRDRTASWDSAISGVSENTVDYDVVPRGTIYLLGCTVLAYDAVSKPHEHLFAFCVHPPNRATESTIYLAARSAAARDDWIAKIHAVCRVGSPPRQIGSSSSSSIPATEPPPPRQQSALSPMRRQYTPPPSSSNETTTTRSAAVSSLSRRQTGQPRMAASSLNRRGTVTPPRTSGNMARSRRQMLLLQRSCPESSFADGRDYDDDEDDDENWKTLGSPTAMYATVPETLQERIQEQLKLYLSLCDTDNCLHQSSETSDNINMIQTNNSPWKELFANESSGHCAYQRTDAQGRATIKSTAVLNHPVKQVFALLIDISRRQEYETNIRADERMQILNPHTFLDYYAYKPVWPTHGREFTVATHWEVVGKGDERAIAIISFSCPEASALRPETPKHVRANLFVSMYLLRPTPSRDLRNGNEQCHFTRYLSFDLAGTVNTHLSNAITIQQATIPVIITEFLQRTEPTVEDRYNGLLTNETVVNSVIKHTAHGSTTIGSLPLLRPPSPLSGEDDLCHPKLAYDIEHGNGRVPSVESQAIVLFAPVVLYYILDFCIIPGAALSFCIAGFLAIRQVVLWFVGEAMSLSDEQSFLGPVTCRFSVDLKGIHRFIANKKEEQDELNNGNTEISLVHIVACSLARALKKEPTLICRRIVIPWLWIDRVVDRRFDPVNVSVSENGSGLVTLKNVDVRKVQSLANDLAAADRRTNATRDICQCLVISSSSVDSEMVTEAAPVQRDVCVVAIIGGIRMERMSKPRRNNGTNGESRRPFLSLSLTISRQQQQSDIVTCRRFAGEVRKLLAYPEILESE